MASTLTSPIPSPAPPPGPTPSIPDSSFISSPGEESVCPARLVRIQQQCMTSVGKGRS